MPLLSRRRYLVLAAAFFALTAAGQAAAQGAQDLNTKAQLALDQLLRDSPSAAAISNRARAVLVFPNIVKGGFIVGGEYGEGTLFENGTPSGNYAIGAASFGLQAGAQSYSQALFFMTDEALNYLEESNGFELGGDLGFALGSQGGGGSVTSTTLQQPVVAYAFGQQGLMAGITFEGARIVPIER